MPAAEPASPPPVDPSLRVVRIVIEGLFDQFTHDIPLNQTDRVTVLHGPNGVGKTKVMEMVKGALTHDGRPFESVPFTRLVVEFSNGTKSTTLRNDKGQLLGQNLSKLPCLLVETQRLLRFKASQFAIEPGEGRILPRVNEVAAGMLERFIEVMSAYGRESQALDRSYPQRVIAKGKGPILSADALTAKLAALEATQKELQGLGLLDPGDVAPPDLSSLESLNETERRAMTLYVTDTEKKLSVLSDFAARLRLFLRVTPQFLRKRLRFDRQEGLKVETEAGRSLKLDLLSSGEQHQLVLNYELLFATKPNTLVLIDEPELSLHVSWQKRLLPNLIAIAKLSQIDIVVGTHSPFVIGDRADLMVALGGEADRYVGGDGEAA
ncbi:MAG TPA: AAA family ATPase [Pseudomonadota bacterium]|nr:AAA family ATPase [Pseudomonadota bacterium]